MVPTPCTYAVNCRQITWPLILHVHTHTPHMHRDGQVSIEDIDMDDDGGKASSKLSLETK